MHIIYFLAHPTGIGGASNVMLKQARMMQNIGHTVRIVIQNDKEEYHSPIFDEICDKYGLQSVSLTYSIATCIEDIDIIDCLNRFESICREINLFKPDIIHSLQLNTVVEMAARKLNIPHVMSVYPISKGMFNLEWMDIFPKFHIGDSWFYCDKWEQGLGIRTECIRVGYEGKAPSENMFAKRAEYEIVCIGVLSSYKNQLEIIRFIDMCCDKQIDVHLSVLGDYDNPYGDKCRHYVSEHDLTDKVDFCGVVLEVENYLQLADLMIHASMTESYPGVIVEAMANRVPIMVAPVGGILELVENDVNGICINGFSYRDIWDSFVKFINYKKQGKIKELIQRAFVTYQENHTDEILKDKLEKYYIDIISNGNRTGGFIGIGELEHLFLPYRQRIGVNDDYTAAHIWYIYYIEKQLKKYKYKTVYIWGAGNYGKVSYEWCTKIFMLDIKGFIDKSRVGTYLGCDIFLPSDIILSADVIFVAIANIDACQEIGVYLGKLGFVRNKSYFFIVNNPCMKLE